MPEYRLSVSEALEAILGRTERLEPQPTPLLEAAGRYLAEEAICAESVPPFNNSAMDGYAVRWEDVAGAEPSGPKRLKLVDELPAGKAPQIPVGPGEAIRIFTGAPMPEGADTVVIQEDTDGSGKGEVEIRQAPGKGENLRAAGEDLQKGETLFGAGRRLSAADAGLLASLGYPEVKTYRRPNVAILSTGDELVEPGQPCGPGQIRNSNSYTLAALVRQVGANPVKLAIARDTPEEIRGRFEEGLKCDMALSSGGVSVGEYDYVMDAWKSLGVELNFWKIRQKPGRPLAFGVHGKTPIVGLPGNPVSVMVGFHVYVRPALLKMMGATEWSPFRVRARLMTPIESRAGRVDFARVILSTDANGEYEARLTGSQGSGVLRSMSLAHGLVAAPEEAERLEEGEMVWVEVFDPDRLPAR